MADFTNIVSEPETSRWIGYTIKSLPKRDWRSFVQGAYVLEFSYVVTGDIETMWVEITNYALGKKIHKKPIELRNVSGKFALSLAQFQTTVEDWKSVDEICFVAFPEECLGQQGTICITDITIGQ